MKIDKIIFHNQRFDFKAIFKCEHCGHTYEAWGYDDYNYHYNVVSNVCCSACGLNSNKENQHECERRTGRIWRL